MRAHCTWLVTDTCDGLQASEWYLDLELLIAGQAEIVHVVVGVVGIASALVFDKCEAVLGQSCCLLLLMANVQSTGGCSWGRDVAAD